VAELLFHVFSVSALMVSGSVCKKSRSNFAVKLAENLPSLEKVHAFSYAGPCTWNERPGDLRSVTSTATFKTSEDLLFKFGFKFCFN